MVLGSLWLGQFLTDIGLTMADGCSWNTRTGKVLCRTSRTLVGVSLCLTSSKFTSAIDTKIDIGFP